ncbi:GTP 3',8-cyclase MoaA [Pelotomaculum terephthalicicum JT]|uniref:GTP 3',8-cyclase MoaA n=1 Tax=Pelotomaculum TaxID=191373 RepID=UPI0009CE595A|nr:MULTISPECIES: GTP 3',8-cyclase MoaA [Pelotomaculum]MCG9967665.1 GTP 3',8-cyclase MoaA [Pelotomaculum terephthalicicum JT]OPX84039.1 MAG: Cyclic pyranopterin monophosphate synthase [Pelotomaculum sp. PtaB.Bin117]OPY59606.1 MAG: Cyclic pyranopterin monophosphate synthase [Pelotomaculum sp. PtaU1.Bin065]
MRDKYQREINYLRVSVTDRCNLRCVYCMPPEGVKFVPHKEILSFEEIEVVIRAAAYIGVKKVRLTGGEPLVRRGVERLVGRISNIPGIDDIALTTNGLILPKYAEVLKEAGLRRVNISLDTLDSDRYHEFTRYGKLSRVWEGIISALDAGFHPVKLNTVVIRGFNDDEVVDIARLTMEKPLHVRFIEIMPIGSSNSWVTGRFVPAEEIMSRIGAKLGQLIPAKIPEGSGPAKYYRLEGAQGTVGFITSMSDHFCSNCNRLRLTSTGSLRPCLYDRCEIDLRTPLRDGAGIKEIAGLIRKAVSLKADRHHMLDGWQDKRVMSQIGG